MTIAYIDDAQRTIVLFLKKLFNWIERGVLHALRATFSRQILSLKALYPEVKNCTHSSILSSRLSANPDAGHLL